MTPSLPLALPQPRDPLAPWISHLTRQGVALYKAGQPTAAAAKWRQAQALEPEDPTLATCLMIAGASPAPPTNRRPDRVVVRVPWPSPTAARRGPADRTVRPRTPHRCASDQEELYEVLRERALTAFRHEAWDLAETLLSRCAERRPGHHGVDIMLQVTRAQRGRRIAVLRAA